MLQQTPALRRRSQKEPEHQTLEYAALNRLADGEVVREAALRSASGATKSVLQAMLRKKWIARDDLSDVRDASRTIQMATLKNSEGKLNANQQKIVNYLGSQEGRRAPVEAVRQLDVPRTTLQTLVRRGVVELSNEAADLPRLRTEAAQAGIPLHARAETSTRYDHRRRR